MHLSAGSGHSLTLCHRRAPVGRLEPGGKVHPWEIPQKHRQLTVQVRIKGLQAQALPFRTWMFTFQGSHGFAAKGEFVTHPDAVAVVVVK